MIIKNVLVFKDTNYFTPGQIIIENGRFCNSASSEHEVLDGKGCYAIPGLIDIHFHGSMGYDFCDASVEAIAAIADYQAQQGITAIAPATMTLPKDLLSQIMSTAASYTNTSGATLVGINMEGPFISADKKGAQASTHIIPCDSNLFRELQMASNGLIKLVDIAPEESGAMKFIQDLKDEVHISLAHTNADYITAKQAYDLGACHATHLYNAMSPFSHRDPGVVGAARDSSCMVELICDSVHIHPSVVRATFQMFGANRIVMISDCIRATGMPDGQYTLGGQDVTVIGNHATLTDTGSLAGSVTNLMDCLRIAVKQMGIPLETAVTCSTINPARAIGIEENYGSISTGKIGNVVLLNSDLQVEKTIINGMIYH
ncbi:MAG: N-acetylglucosamine-6-phosphate deacetylase [Lachnospiraceae bacterium]